MITIIENTPATLPTLGRLFSAYQQAICAFTQTASPFTPFEEATAGELLLLALKEGCVAGFVSVWLPDGFIHHLYVDTAYRQQGIATALLQAVIARTGLPVQLKCLNANTATLQFYKQAGFQCIATGSSAEGLYQLMEISAV